MSFFWYSLEVSHFPESKITYFLEVEDYEELRGQSFSIVGHKHGNHIFCLRAKEYGLKAQTTIYQFHEKNQCFHVI